MNVVYLLPTLPPQSAQVEAIAQEIALLSGSFGRDIVYVNPNSRWPLIPRFGFGWHTLPRLRSMAPQVDLFHFFNPDPYPYPFLLGLPKPVVYTITAGIRNKPPLAYLRRMAMVTVPDERTLAQLQQWGLSNVAWQRPGIATQRFTHTPQSLARDEPLRLLVASAPWSPAQFSSKGFDALLTAAQQTPDLRLTLLWRGQFSAEIHARIAAGGVADRVTVIDETVDVNAMLARAHAAAIFATAPGIIKSYPHSLLDALAAGKPVLLNRTIAMADYVETEACGVVIDTVTPEAIAAALTTLRDGYAAYSEHARRAGQRDFTEQAARSAVAAIYTRALGTRAQAAP